MAENTAVKGNQLVEPKALEPTIKDVDILINGFKSLETEMKGVLKVSKDIAKISQGNKKEDIKAVNQAYKQSTEAVKKIVEQEKKLVKQEKELAKLTRENIKTKEKEAARIKATSDEVVKEKLKRAAASKEQKERLNELIILERRQLGTEEKILKENKKLRTERRQLNTETEKGASRLRQINAQLDKNNAVIEKNADKLKKQKIGVGRYTDGVKSAISQSGIFSSQLATLDKIYKLLSFNIISSTASTEAQTVAVNRQTKARRLLNFAIKGTSKGLNLLAKGSIGVVIVALGSLVQFFTRTQKGVEALSVAMAGIGAAFGVVLDRFTDVGEIFFDLFNGTISLSEATDKLAVSFKGSGEEIEKEIALAIDLDKKLKALEKTENSFIIVRARRLQRSKELRLESKEENKTLSERIRLLKDARNELEINSIEEEELAVKRFQQILQIKDLEDARKRLNDLTEEGIDIDLSEVGFGTSLEKDRKEALQVAKQIIDIRSKNADQQRTIQSEILGLIKKDAKEREAIAEANNKRLTELQGNRILKQLALEQKRYEKELAAAKKHKEDLILVEKVHQKNIAKIESDLFKSKLKATELSIKDNSLAEDEARIKGQAKEIADKKQNAEISRQQKLAENEARIQLAQAVSDKIAEIEDVLNGKRLQSINNELSKFSEQRNLLQIEAKKGNADALNSIQDLDKRQAELEAQRERELNKRRVSELIMIGLKLLTANLNSGSNGNEAISKTAQQITQTTALIQSLPSFESGIDDTSDIKTHSSNMNVDNKRGMKVIVHPDEMILNKKNANKVRGSSNISGDIVADVMQKYHNGQLTEANKSFSDVSTSYTFNDANLIAEMKANTKAVTKAIAEQKTFFEQNADAIITRTRYQNNIINNHNKIRGF